MYEIRHGDCVTLLQQLDAESVELVFADPPFNIGYDYDVYRDALESNQYLEWCRRWIGAVHRVVRPNGAFWLAIGDEYAAELKVLSQQIGFHCRSWVVWYYTFGVNCERKFTRSHAHLFHFVKDPQNFVFLADAPENRIPSARQLVYNDRRANPKGRLPDDTWIIPPAEALGELTPDEPGVLAVPLPADEGATWTLRPQDLAHCFRAEEDTWYFPRVAGTFKERAGFHGCQMPEQLLGRIIRTCSEPGGLVLDPFSGSGTTVAVAKKLGRQCLGFDLSKEYVRLGRERLEGIRVGDPLDGSPEPTLSAPPTTRRKGARRQASRATDDVAAVSEAHAAAAQLEQTSRGVVEAFRTTHRGHSADRVVADPELNADFTRACRERGLLGEPRSWNLLLFRMRKAGALAGCITTERTTITWEDCDRYLYAGEIAWRMLLEEERARSLDEILCDPVVAAEFDSIAGRFAPGYSPLEYRWGALKLRKQAKLARVRAATLSPPTRFGPRTSLDEFDPASVAEEPGIYLVGKRRGGQLYVGESLNLRARLTEQFADGRDEVWRALADRYAIDPRQLSVQVHRIPARAGEMLAWQRRLVEKFQPPLNFFH